MIIGTHRNRGSDDSSQPTLAFRQALVDRLPNLRRFSLTLCRHADNADDLVQDTCVRALGRWQQFEPQTRMESWLFAIMHSIWKNQLRRASNQQRALAKYSTLPTQADGEQVLFGKIALSEVLSLMNTLAADQMVAISLVSFHGLSYREAAQVLDIPQGTLESRIARGRIALGRSLDKSKKPEGWHSGRLQDSEKLIMTLGDKLLLKYADDKMDAAASEHIAQQLVTDAPARERLRLIRLSGDALAGETSRLSLAPAADQLADRIFSGELDSCRSNNNSDDVEQVAPDSAEQIVLKDTEQLELTEAQLRFKSRWRLPQVAAALGFLAIGLVGGYFGAAWLPSQASDQLVNHPAWLVRIVDYHTLYGRETVTPSKSSAQQVMRLEKRFTTFLKHDGGHPGSASRASGIQARSSAQVWQRADHSARVFT